jgi:hypothetical protein
MVLDTSNFSNLGPDPWDVGSTTLFIPRKWKYEVILLRSFWSTLSKDPKKRKEGHDEEFTACSDVMVMQHKLVRSPSRPDRPSDGMNHHGKAIKAWAPGRVDTAREASTRRLAGCQGSIKDWRMHGRIASASARHILTRIQRPSVDTDTRIVHAWFWSYRWISSESVRFVFLAPMWAFHRLGRTSSPPRGSVGGAAVALTGEGSFR